MRKIVRTFMAGLIVLCIASSPVLARPDTFATSQDIFFIGTKEDIPRAIAVRDVVVGLALSIKVYLSSTDAEKAELEGIIQHVGHSIDFPPHPVFVYGPGLTSELVQKILGYNDEKKYFSNCVPLAYAGIVAIGNGANDSNNPLVVYGLMCGMTTRHVNETWYRESILKQWRFLKKLYHLP